MSKLYIDENPLLVLPKLVQELGGHVVKAMLLQQLHFLLRQPRSGIDHDGHHWVWKTADEWVEDYFIWLSASTISGYLKQLEDDGYIISTSGVKNVWDRTKFYRLADQNSISDTAEMPSPLQQKCQDRCSGDVLYTESTSESTSKTTATAAIVDTLEKVGVGFNAYTMDQYNDLVQEVGTPDAVIRGILAAADNGKQHSFKYVAACARNIATGTVPKKYSNGKETASDIIDRMSAPDYVPDENMKRMMADIERNMTA